MKPTKKEEELKEEIRKLEEREQRLQKYNDLLREDNTKIRGIISNISYARIAMKPEKVQEGLEAIDRYFRPENQQ